MVVDIVREIVSFKQSKWLEKYKGFEKQKRQEATIDSENEYCKLINNAFDGKTLERCGVD